MVFNIGNQSGGVINNVAGDQHVSGTQYGTVSITDVRSAARELRSAIDRLDLPDPVREELRARAGQVDVALSAERPDRAQVAGRLERLIGVLTRSGALAAAGAALIGPVATIARWLGDAGLPLLRLLPG